MTTDLAKHWRFLLFLVFLDLLIPAGLYLMTGGVRKLTEST